MPFERNHRSVALDLNAGLEHSRLRPAFETREPIFGCPISGTANLGCFQDRAMQFPSARLGKPGGLFSCPSWQVADSVRPNIRKIGREGKDAARPCNGTQGGGKAHKNIVLRFVRGRGKQTQECAVLGRRDKVADTSLGIPNTAGRRLELLSSWK
jgi:hypothetical protein